MQNYVLKWKGCVFMKKVSKLKQLIARDKEWSNGVYVVKQGVQIPNDRRIILLRYLDDDVGRVYSASTVNVKAKS